MVTASSPSSPTPTGVTRVGHHVGRIGEDAHAMSRAQVGGQDLAGEVICVGHERGIEGLGVGRPSVVLPGEGATQHREQVHRAGREVLLWLALDDGRQLGRGHGRDIERAATRRGIADPVEDGACAR